MRTLVSAFAVHIHFSKSKGMSEILRDIRTPTYQICRTGEKIIRTTTFNKFIIMLLDS